MMQEHPQGTRGGIREANSPNKANIRQKKPPLNRNPKRRNPLHPPRTPRRHGRRHRPLPTPPRHARNRILAPPRRNRRANTLVEPLAPHRPRRVRHRVNTDDPLVGREEPRRYARKGLLLSERRAEDEGEGRLDGEVLVAGARGRWRACEGEHLEWPRDEGGEDVGFCGLLGAAEVGV